ncbi:DUF6777 domain-containing protein [Streptomyces hygroscopicus]|uniref:DUF6777 domain-containing protein n=1 Tax=Streptomyces hygroscopicus TaxID=1912 RepID=UPI002AD2C6B3|nr:DUF6777 domain-containing protein [Streptomyces hygroscopicus]
MKAVAAGVRSLAPFFDERSGLGQDAAIRVRQAPGGLQAGNTPGLYGGSRKPTICDVRRLKEFLTDPRNDQKAKVWAQVLGISQAEIPDYLDRLTPVRLRHDTLVQNHDYKKGRATPFDSLLEAGIAVLVDAQGQPTVKCSCGNPLLPFRGDTTRISVTFQDGNRKWAGYDRSSVVAVRPAPQQLARLALVDVDDPNRGIARPVGTTGGHDAPFDTRVRHQVPDVTGRTFAEAGRQLTAQGLAVAYAGKGEPPDEALVTGSDPAPGTELAFGQYVTLSVETGGADRPGGGGPSGTGTGQTGGGAGTTAGAGGITFTPPSSGGTTPSGSRTSPSTPTHSGTTSSPPATGHSSSPPTSGTSSPPVTHSSPPPASHSTTPPPESHSTTPSTTHSSPPTASHSTTPPPESHSTTPSTTHSSPPTASAGGASGKPPTSKPPTSNPRTSNPATSAPVTGKPPVTRDPVTGSPTAGTTWTGE